jgi:hypothetical protein
MDMKESLGLIKCHSPVWEEATLGCAEIKVRLAMHFYITPQDDSASFAILDKSE